MIAIIDYGAGNLQSVKKALDFIGADSVITDNKEGAYRQHYCKHHRNNNIDFSAHFLLPFQLIF